MSLQTVWPAECRQMSGRTFACRVSVASCRPGLPRSPSAPATQVLRFVAKLEKSDGSIYQLVWLMAVCLLWCRFALTRVCERERE